MGKYNLPKSMTEEKDFFVDIISQSYRGPGVFLGLGLELPLIGDIEPVEPDILRVAHYMQKDKREIRIDIVGLKFIKIIGEDGKVSTECENLTLNYNDAKGISSEILTKGQRYNHYKTLLDTLIKAA